MSRKVFRILTGLFAVIVLLTVLPVSAFADTGSEAAAVLSSPSAVSAKAAILIEAESGLVLFEENADEVLPMASTTKIMTALTALELASPDTVISVPKDAVGIEGSSVYLVEGETLTLEELLYAMLLVSANDAAAAIAIGTAGSIQAFAEKMNEKAAEFSLCKTCFANPHGLDDENHHTTARELALIAKEALQNELISKIVSTRKKSIPFVGNENGRLLVNHNKLLRLYEGCTGVKTGFTVRSGRCLVSAAEKSGVKLIAVTLHAPDDWNDHKKLFDFGFSRLEAVSLSESGSERHAVHAVGGKAESLTVANREGCIAVLPVGHGPVRAEVELPRFVYAPIASDVLVGRVVYFCDTDGDGMEETIGDVPLYTVSACEKAKSKRTIFHKILAFFGFYQEE